MQRKWLLIPLVLLCCVLLSGCLAGQTEVSADDLPGFFQGVWHGWMAPISLLLRLFGMEDVRMYEAMNAGIGYDIGFYMAVISGFGGLALIRRKKR